jgi:hypothetical protein
MATDKEPAEVVFDAATKDIESALAVAGARQGWLILETGRPARQELRHLAERWAQALRDPGEAGKKARLRVALDAARSAVAVHESLPGAPPVPAWLADVTHTKGSLSGPPNVITFSDAISEQLSDTWHGAKQIFGPSLRMGLAVGGIALVALVMLWTTSRN